MSLCRPFAPCVLLAVCCPATLLLALCLLSPAPTLIASLCSLAVVPSTQCKRLASYDGAGFASTGSRCAPAWPPARQAQRGGMLPALLPGRPQAALWCTPRRLLCPPAIIACSQPPVARPWRSFSKRPTRHHPARQEWVAAGEAASGELLPWKRCSRRPPARRALPSLPRRAPVPPPHVPCRQQQWRQLPWNGCRSCWRRCHATLAVWRPPLQLRSEPMTQRCSCLSSCMKTTLPAFLMPGIQSQRGGDARFAHSVEPTLSIADHAPCACRQLVAAAQSLTQLAGS